MNKKTRKLHLNRETIRHLSGSQLRGAAGASIDCSQAVGCGPTTYHSPTCAATCAGRSCVFCPSDQGCDPTDSCTC